MTSPTVHRRAFTIFAVIALAGALLVLATIVWRWGHLGYGLGVAALVVGCVGLVAVTVRHRVGRVIAAAVVAIVMVAVGIVAVTGIPSPIAKWADSDFDNTVLGGWAARTGDLLISDGTARDIATGEVVWQLEGSDDATPSLVSDDIVVIATDDESVALDPKTGRELWRSPITGVGITHNGDVLVVSRFLADDQTEAVALDLDTGETVWTRPGRPVMECDLGPANRYSPASERSHVLVVVDGENENRAELVDVKNGGVTVGDVDCSITARLVGDVLLQASGDVLEGRSLDDGESLWATSVAQPFAIEGGGPTVFTPSGASSNDVTAIDVATGVASEVSPSEGALTYLSGLEVRRAPEVWTLLDLEPGAALWNPGTGAIVEIAGATSVQLEGIDVSSGWMAISGRTRDFTGEESKQCWAVARDGTLYGPVPRTTTCLVGDGLIETSAGVFPVG